MACVARRLVVVVCSGWLMDSYPLHVPSGSRDESINPSVKRHVLLGLSRSSWAGGLDRPAGGPWSRNGRERFRALWHVLGM